MSRRPQDPPPRPLRTDALGGAGGNAPVYLARASEDDGTPGSVVRVGPIAAESLRMRTKRTR